jgi:hypothetical protein
VFRKLWFFVCLLLITTTDVSAAQAGARPDTAGNARNNQSGTWSAKASSGLTLQGTWTAVLDTTGGTVTGSWTVMDAAGKTVAYGGWSAAKAPTQWTGAWRAVVAGKQGEYSGTWNAGVDLKGDARFVDLFEKAAQSVVSGTWRSGNNAGAWSIRAAKRE